MHSNGHVRFGGRAGLRNRPGVYYTWHQVGSWLRRKHRRSTWKDLRRRYCDAGWWPSSEERPLFNPAKVATTRYRYRGTAIPTPWPNLG